MATTMGATAMAEKGANQDPRHHVHKMSARLEETIDHLRSDVALVEEPQFRAMFETAAEVIGGLVTAFKHYGQKGEAAWRR
jgi:hypothetical protein